MSTIYIFEEITLETAQRVLQELADPNVDTVFINSPGGDVAAAMGIFDALCTRNVTTVASGMVASAAVLVFLAGTKRYAYPRIHFMIHPVELDADNVRAGSTAITDLEQSQKELVDIMAERTKQSHIRITRMLAAATYFGFEQAVADGFIHGVWPQPLQEAA